MFARVARVGFAVLCAAALLGVAAGPAAAKEPKARASVVGGGAASLEEWGFTAAVLGPTTLCTGDVLSPTKVLTAAHCVGNLPTMIVRTNSLSAFVGGEVSGVVGVATSPGYANGFRDDLAVLTLRTPTSAPAVQVATAEENAAYTRLGAPLAVAGFGNRNPLLGREQIGVLTATDVVVRPCPLPAWAICDSGGRAGAAIRHFRGHVFRRKVKKAICSGDSGGPLIARTPAGPRLVGVAEASSGPRKPNPFFFVICGLKGYPSLHTRLSGYVDFINANLSD